MELRVCVEIAIHREIAVVVEVETVALHDEYLVFQG